MSREEKLSVPFPTGAFRDPPSDDFDLQINLRFNLDKIADEVTAEITQKPNLSPSRRALCELARRIYESRRVREKVLDGQLFGEPAWDMLLALFYMPANGEFLTVKGVSCVANVPPTTGLRWQGALTDAGLIKRGPSIDGDGRVILVGLTDQGRALMTEYLTRIYHAGAG